MAAYRFALIWALRISALAIIANALLVRPSDVRGSFTVSEIYVLSLVPAVIGAVLCLGVAEAIAMMRERSVRDKGAQ